MHVRAVRASRDECAEQIRPYIQDPCAFITLNREYEVQAIAVSHGLVLLQIVNDLNCPDWLPGALFEMVSSALPTDWICNLFFYSNISDGRLLLGPEFIASSEETYEAMVEAKPQQVRLFWERVDSTTSGRVAGAPGDWE
jgi:hypothetical protein